MRELVKRRADPEPVSYELTPLTLEDVEREVGVKPVVLTISPEVVRAG